MKSVYLILMFLILSAASYAQLGSRVRQTNTKETKDILTQSRSYIYYEDFQSQQMPEDMTIINEDGSPLPPADAPNFTNAWVVGNEPSISADDYFALSTSYHAPDVAADWMITPLISIGEGAWLEWESMILFGWGGTTQDYEIYITTTIQGDTPVAADFTEPAVFTLSEADDYFQIETINLDELGYANTDIWVAFKNVSQGSTDVYAIDILIIDDIKVHAPSPVDAELISINTPYINDLSLDVKGTVKNVGVDVITSFDVTYTINGENESDVFTVSGISLEMNETYDFSHNTPHIFPETGNYVVEVSISNVNTDSDSNSGNNHLTKSIIIGQDNSLNKTVLFEYIGSNDQPLGGGMFDVYATGQNTLRSEIIDKPENYAKSTLISYELNPDPYEIQECVDRNDFYNFTSDPSSISNGRNDIGYNDIYFNIDSLYHLPAFFNIQPEYSLNGDDISVSITIEPYASLTADCHVAIVEKTTTGNVGASEAAAYYHVLMKMLPDANGTEVNLIDGQNYSYSVSYDLSTTNIEEIDDIEVVVFLQDAESKYVYQSAYASMTTSVLKNEIGKMDVYPNPSSGIINVELQKKASVRLYNVLGEEVLSISDVNKNVRIDISHLSNGTYILEITDENAVETCKVNLSK